MEVVSLTYYLVDTENVAQRWIRTVADAAPGDTFLLFYSHNVGTVNMSAFGPGCLRGIRFEFIGCAVGSNAIDFQICTELGRLTALHQGDSFCILSGDGGFDAVVRYWRDRNVDVRREAPAIPEEHDPERSVQDVYKTMLRDAGIAGDDLAVAAGILVAAMRLPQNERKLNTLNRFTARYGAEDGRARYNQVKDVVKHISVEGPFPEAASRADAVEASSVDDGQSSKTQNSKSGKSGRSAPGTKGKAKAAKPAAKAPKRLSDKVKAVVPNLNAKEAIHITNIVNRAKQKGDASILRKGLESSYGLNRSKMLYALTVGLLSEK